MDADAAREPADFNHFSTETFRGWQAIITGETMETRQFTATVVSLIILGAGPAYAQSMEISPNGSRLAVIWTPPGVKHWHGATATSGMSHMAITNRVDGKSVEWMGHVSDEQYRN